MADFENKTSDNVDGLFFVDSECIACDACTVDAPSFFKMNKDKAYAYVFIQPINNNDLDLCNEALENCPVEAIGKQKKPPKI